MTEFYNIIYRSEVKKKSRLEAKDHRSLGFPGELHRATAIMFTRYPVKRLGRKNKLLRRVEARVTDLPGFDRC